MANKRITDVDFLESLNSDESFFVNHNNSIRQINRGNITFDIINGGTGAKDASGARANLEAQKQHNAVSVILLSGDWSDGHQTVRVNGVSENNTIVVTPNPASRVLYGESEICCSAQANGTLTFECVSTPNEELMVNVLILD